MSYNSAKAALIQAIKSNKFLSKTNKKRFIPITLFHQDFPCVQIQDLIGFCIISNQIYGIMMTISKKFFIPDEVIVRVKSHNHTNLDSLLYSMTESQMNQITNMLNNKDYRILGKKEYNTITIQEMVEIISTKIN